MVFIAYVLSSLRLLIQAQNQWTNYINGNPLYAWRKARDIFISKSLPPPPEEPRVPGSRCPGLALSYGLTLRIGLTSLRLSL